MKCKTHMKKRQRMTWFQIQDENSVQFHSIQTKKQVSGQLSHTGNNRVEHRITQRNY